MRFFLVKQERIIRQISTIRHAGKATGMFSSRNKREYSKVSRAVIHMSFVHCFMCELPCDGGRVRHMCLGRK